MIEALHEETSLHQAMEYLQRENGMVNANITSNSSSSTSPASLVQRHSSVERHLDTRLDFQSIEAPRHQTLSLSYNRIHELQKSSSATEEFIPQKSRYDSGNEIMSVAFDWGNKFSFSTNEVDLIAQSLRSSPQYTSLPSGTTESPLMIHSPQDDCKEKVFGMLNQDEDCEPFEFNVGDFELKDHFFVSDSKSKSERSLHESDPKSFAK